MSKQPVQNPSAEVRRRGEEIYDRVVRPYVDESQKGKVVAIDVESETFVIDDTVIAAADRLREQRADGIVWLTRIGHLAFHSIGGRSRTTR